MKISKEFKKISALADSILRAKEEAREVIEGVDERRVILENLENEAKRILKL